MPGPQFGKNQDGPGWLSANYRKLFYVLTLALMAAGAWYFYQSYQARTALLKPALEGTVLNDNPATAAASSEAKITVSSAPAAAKQNDGRIIVTAASGHGQTHLARQALKEYLKDKPELASNLSPEQRIYIEDYLRKHLAGQSRGLRVGDQIAFPSSDIEDAINLALNLTDSQLTNLSRYVPLVPSLMTPRNR